VQVSENIEVRGEVGVAAHLMTDQS
jgi:hypothetical protein